MEETISDVVYVSKSSIEQKQGPLRIAQWSAQVAASSRQDGGLSTLDCYIQFDHVSQPDRVVNSFGPKGIILAWPAPIQCPANMPSRVEVNSAKWAAVNRGLGQTAIALARVCRPGDGAAPHVRPHASRATANL